MKSTTYTPLRIVSLQIIALLISFAAHASCTMTIGLTSSVAGCGGTGIELSVNMRAGESGPFTYIWSNGATTSTLTNVPAGNYCVTVTNASGCEGSACEDFDPGLQQCEDFEGVSLSQAYYEHAFNTYGNGNNPTGFLSKWFVPNGTPSVYRSAAYANVLAFSGSQYALLGICNLNETEGLEWQYPFLPGQTYQITLNVLNAPTDAASSPANVDFYLLDNLITHSYNPVGSCTTTPTAPTSGSYLLPGNASILALLPSTSWSTHTITFTAPAGSHYQYLWIRASMTSGYLGLGSSSSALAIDKICITPVPNNPLTVSGVVTRPTCHNGSITAQATGGEPGYSYLWSNGANTATISGLSDGMYQVTVTDNRGCAVVQSFSIHSPFMVTISKVDAHCPYNDDGEAQANILPFVGSAATYHWSNGLSGSHQSGLSPGHYDVTVTRGGCSVVKGVDILSTLPDINIDATPSGDCAHPTMTLTMFNYIGFPPPTTGSYLWSNGATTSSTIATTSGNYSVTYTDVDGCSGSATYNVLLPSSPLAITFTIVDADCGQTNGKITASATGGAGLYRFSWAGGASGEVRTGLAPGSYTVTVMDDYGCSATATASVSTFIHVHIEMVAAGPCSSPSFSLRAIDGNGVPISTAGGLTVNWSTGQHTPFISVTTPGTYSVSVTDNANRCGGFATFNFQLPSPLHISTTKTNADCQAYNGSITAYGINGVPPYTYAWSGGAVTQSITGLGVGIYTVTVTDALGCKDSAKVRLDNGLLVHITSSTSGTCAAPIYHLTVLDDNNLPYGGSGDLVLWASPLSGSANPKDITTPGEYYVLVQRAGCWGIASITVTAPTAFTASATAIAATSCLAANGQATATPTGGVAPYTYLWSNGQTTTTIYGLSPAPYQVTITDHLGCTATASVTVGGGLSLVAYQFYTGCADRLEPNAGVDASGGTAPYIYAWSDYYHSTTATISDVTLGETYTVTVTDNNGCSTTTSIFLGLQAQTCENFDAVSLTTAQKNNAINSYGNGNESLGDFLHDWYVPNGTPDIAASGDFPGIIANSPNQFAIMYVCGTGGSEGLEWNYNFQPGMTYQVTMKLQNIPLGSTPIPLDVDFALLDNRIPFIYDINGGCVTNPLVPAGSLTVGPALRSYASAAWTTHTITFTVPITGPAFHYLWIRSKFANPYGGETTILSLDDICIKPVGRNQMSVDGVIANPSCNGTCNGTITTSITGGVAPYNYFWSNGSSSANLSSLCAGDYTVTVTDANGCTTSQSFNLHGPLVISVSTSAAACNNNNGSASISVSGGATPYTYLWPDGDTHSNRHSLAAGVYHVTVTDHNGCAAVVDVVVKGPLQGIISYHVNGSCNNVSYTLSFTDANGIPFSGGTIEWRDLTTNPSATLVTYYTFITNDAHTYSVVYTDINGCKAVGVITIPPYLPFTMHTWSRPSLCGSNTGTATVAAIGGAGPYTYNWAGGSTATSLTGLSAGTYAVTAHDSHGCSATQTVTVTASMDIDMYVHNAGTCSSPFVQLIPTDNAGHVEASSSYLWSTGSTTIGYQAYASGTYSVTVTNTAGCTGTANATVVVPTPLTAAATSSGICNVDDAIVTAHPNGGSAPYTYNWGSTVANPTSQVINHLSAGTYTVTVTDAIGCTATASVTVSRTIAIAGVVTDATCNGTYTGAIDITITGGSAPYTTWWYPTGQLTQDINNLLAGTYNIIVTDANGCINSETYTVNQYSAVTATVATTNVTSCNLHNGRATVTPAGGTAPYTYTWSNGETTASVTDLASGYYRVTVTDLHACTFATDLQIGGGILLAGHVFNTGCNGTYAVNVGVNVTGANAPLTYAWSNGSTASTINNATPLTTYCVTVTDNSGCTASTCVTPAAPGISKCEDFDDFDVHATSSEENAFNDYGNVNQIHGNALNDWFVPNGTPSVYESNATGYPNVSASSPNQYALLSVCENAAGDYSEGVEWGYSFTAGQSYNVQLNSRGLSNNGNNVFSPLTVEFYLLTARIPYVYQITACSQTPPIPPGAQLVSSFDINTVGPWQTNSFTFSPAVSNYGYLWIRAKFKDAQAVNGGKSSVFAFDHICIKPATDNELVVGGSIQSYCANTCNGSITTTVTGGILPYTYLWSDGVTTADRSALCQGTYSVTATDAHGCTASQIFTLDAPIFGYFPNSFQQPTSCNAANGKICFGMIGGSGPFTYTFNGVTTTTTSRTICLENLPAGNYSTSITDANGCTLIASGTIRGGVVLDVTTTNAGCNRVGGSVCVTPTGGATPYTYSWSNGLTVSCLTHLAPGHYCVTVTDRNGCSATTCGDVATGNIVLAAAQTNPSCHGNCNGIANVTPSGGATPYTYLWNTGAVTSSINALCAGTYHVTVTDATRCSATSDITLTEPDELSVTVNATAVSSCSAMDGAATATIIGGTPIYHYTWSTGSNMPSVSGLAPGNYHLTITDAKGCQKVTDFTISGGVGLVPHLSLHGCNFDEITVSVSTTSGTPAYTYQWSNGSTASSIPNAAAGTAYCVTVTDANGCIGTDCILSALPPGVICEDFDNFVVGTHTEQAFNEYGNINETEHHSYLHDWLVPNGTPSVYPDNGLGIHGYLNTQYALMAVCGDGPLVSEGLEWRQTFAAGQQYRVSLEAGNSNAGSPIDVDFILLDNPINYGYATNVGCTTTAVIPLGALVVHSEVNYTAAPLTHMAFTTPVLTATYHYMWIRAKFTSGATQTTAIFAFDHICMAPVEDALSVTRAYTVPCHGECTGTITPTVSGGQAPYTYQWNDGITTTLTRTGLCNGSYRITVTDANNCTVEEGFNLNSALLVVMNHANNATCGRNNGHIDFSATGNGPFTYTSTIDYPTIHSMPGDIGSLTDLAAGAYTVTVTDANGCTKAFNDNIGATDMVITTTSQHAGCRGENGSICATPINGQAPYTYIWTNGQTTNCIAPPAGHYCVTVTDASGCSHAACGDVHANGITLATSATDVACYGNCDGKISVNASTGTAPFTYSWSNGANASTVYNMCEGTYTVTVTDATGCSSTSSVTVSGPNKLSVSTIVTNASGCSESDGQIDFTITGGTSPYSYTTNYDPMTHPLAGNSGSLAGLHSGNYTINITDAHGCKTSVSATVLGGVVISLNSTSAGCDGSGGSLCASVVGGATPYIYTWPTGGITSCITNVAAGNYCVTVVDANGCSASACGNVNQTVPVVDIKFTNVSCKGNCDGSAYVNLPVFSSYNWSNGATTMAINMLCAGTYTVTVTDATGCTGTGSVTITEPSNSLSVNVNGDDAHCNALGNVYANPSGGTTPYNYHWSPMGAPATQNLNNVPSGTYAVTVTDASGCTATGQYTVNQNGDGLLVTVSHSYACTDEGDHSATAHIFDGGGTFTYQWSDNSGNGTPGSGQTTETATHLANGHYTVTMTDQNGCMGVGAVDINDICCFNQGYQLTHHKVTQTEVNGYAAGTTVVWPDKIFVEELLLIPTNVTLDITNCDVVFGNQQAGIQFTGWSHLRANNSVFRPCEENDSWNGIALADTSSGQVNSCTFKNAFAALQLAQTTDQEVHVPVANTLFKDCFVGILLNAHRFSSEVSSNIFLRDENYPLPLIPLFHTNFGMLIEESDMTGSISQNNFIYGPTQFDPVEQMIGIMAMNSHLSVAKNNFNNLRSCLMVDGVENSVAFNANEVSYLQNDYVHASNIHAVEVRNVDDAVMVSISNNKFINDHALGDGDAGASPSNVVAIYTQDVSNLWILENEIQGFSIPIQMENCDNSFVVSNVLTDFEEQGIYTNGCDMSVITLNELKGIGYLMKSQQVGIHLFEPSGLQLVSKNNIRMHGIADEFDNVYNSGNGTYNSSTYTGVSNGIEYTKSNANDGLPAIAIHQIKDNCIFDTHTGIYFYDGNQNSTDGSLPFVNNNFLYNYTDFGLYNEWYKGNADGNIHGDIGNDLNAPISAGRNSFISNFLTNPVNWGSAMDIFSANNPIYSYGNSSNLVLNTNVQLLYPETTYTSNNSCGAQVGNNEVEVPTADLAPEAILKSYGPDQVPSTKFIVTKAAGTYNLVPDYLDNLSKMQSQRMEVSMTALTMLGTNTDLTAYDAFHHAVMGAQLLSNDETNIFQYAYLSHNNDLAAIATLLSGLQPSNLDMADWKSLRQLALTLKTNHRSTMNLTASEITMLKGIAQRGGKYSSEASAMLSATPNNAQRVYVKAVPPHNPKRLESVVTRGKTFEVFPNPFSNSFKLVYRIEEDLVNAEAIVTDVLGRVINRTPLTNQNGSVEFNLASEADGFYILTVFSNGKKFAVNKVVKN